MLLKQNKNKNRQLKSIHRWKYSFNRQKHSGSKKADGLFVLNCWCSLALFVAFVLVSIVVCSDNKFTCCLIFHRSTGRRLVCKQILSFVSCFRRDRLLVHYNSWSNVTHKTNTQTSLQTNFTCVLRCICASFFIPPKKFCLFISFFFWLNVHIL